MLSRAVATSLLFLLAGTSAADEKPAKPKRVEKLWAGDAEVGQYGPIVEAEFRREYRIEEINSSKQMLIREVFSTSEGLRFIVDGMDTSKLVTGRTIELKGLFKVVRTARRGKQQLLVFEPLTAEEKKQWGEKEKE